MSNSTGNTETTDIRAYADGVWAGTVDDDIARSGLAGAGVIDIADGLGLVPGFGNSIAFRSRGELIGVNFDRTWLSTMSDIAFDPAFCRNIALDIRYVLFVIDRIGDASYLFEEMDFAE